MAISTGNLLKLHFLYSLAILFNMYNSISIVRGHRDASPQGYIGVDDFRNLTNLTKSEPIKPTYNGNLHDIILLSQGKRTFQSTTFYDRRAPSAAYLAVDGKTGGHLFSDKTCTHTERDFRPYLIVDLSNQAKVFKVVAHLRTDCCTDRYRNLSVLVTDYNPVAHATKEKAAENLALVPESNRCGKVINVPVVNPKNSSVTFQCKIIGRYVTFYMDNENFLSVCELQVYGHYVSPCEIGSHRCIEGVSECKELNSYNDYVCECLEGYKRPDGQPNDQYTCVSA